LQPLLLAYRGEGEFGGFKHPPRNSEVLTKLRQNSLKVQKIKNFLLYEVKFLVPNYICLQNPWLGGYCPQIPVPSVHCPKLNLLNPTPEQTSWVLHWPLPPPGLNNFPSHTNDTYLQEKCKSKFFYFCPGNRVFDDTLFILWRNTLTESMSSINSPA
jgi:hypothetical protein